MGYKISIIIAMYNIESYIAECIESCINSTRVTELDYEIIIVNDGSSDKSEIIAKRYAERHNNLRIINKKNGGLSDARNTGLQHAKGRYIWFIDGDDKISPDAISTIIENINRYSCDAYIINFQTFNNNGIQETSHFKYYDIPLSGKELHCKNRYILPQMAWLSIYKRHFLLNYNLTFFKGIIHEDWEFSIRAHHLCSSILFINKPLYLYRLDNATSIIAQSLKDNTPSLIAYSKIIPSLDIFFKRLGEKNSWFSKYVLAICASNFFKLIYSESLHLNKETSLLLKRRWRYYRYMAESLSFKRIVFLIFIIITPKQVIKKFFLRFTLRSNLT